MRVQVLGGQPGNLHMNFRGMDCSPRKMKRLEFWNINLLSHLSEWAKLLQTDPPARVPRDQDGRTVCLRMVIRKTSSSPMSFRRMSCQRGCLFFFFMCQKGKLRTIVCSHVFSMCLSELSDDCLTGSNCSAGGRVLCLAHRGVKASGVLLHAARHNDVGAKFEFGKTHSLQHGAI